MSAPDFLAWLGPRTYANEIEALSSSLSPKRFSGAMQLWASDHVIPIGDHGVIIGHLFDRSARSDQIRSFDATEARAIIATDGQRLLSNYWGGYVAFLRGTNGEISVIRDPSGAVPAYYRSTTEGIWITAELGHGPFAPGTGGIEPDGDALLVHLWNPFYLGRQTCLKNVEELLPGHRLRYLDSISRTEVAWSPSSFLPTRMTPDIDAADLRTIVMNAVQAWAIPFDSILTGLSGGLDSSIVCVALAGSTAQNHGLNLIWPDREGDEQIPAQLVADFLETDLTASLYNLDHIAIERPIVSTAARPFTSHYVQGIVAQRMALMEHLPIDAFFSGNGGDNVFCLIRSVAPILDRAHSGHGLAALFSTISDVIRLTGTDYLTVLHHLASRAWRKATQPPSGNDDHLNLKRLREAIANVDQHPWDMIDGGAKPGSLAHIRMIRRAMGNDGFHPRSCCPPSIAPLLSQPVMEACLSIPSWRWVQGGMDRSLARQAFANDLPAEIIGRKVKGGPSGYLERYFFEKEAQIVSYLRAGRLAHLGLLASTSLASSFSSDGVHDPSRAQRLLEFAGVESWTRHWSGY